MKLHYLFGFAVCGLLVFGCGREPQVESGQETEAAAEELLSDDLLDGPYFKGVAQVFLDEETAMQVASLLDQDRTLTRSATFGTQLESIGVTRVERVFPDAGEFEERGRALGMHRWYRITYDRSVPREEARDILMDIPGFLFYEPVMKVQVNAVDYPFNDPRLPEQWSYYNDGTGTGWRFGADINVYPVWLNYTTGSPDVVVAVVDGGIDADHEDLKGQVDRDNSFNFYQNIKTYTPDDHGTHVGGTIAAINNNGIGVSSVAGGDAAAGNPGVRLISCAIFDPEQKSSGDGAQAIRWAADHGAVICNNSWGYDFQNDDGSYDSEGAQRSHEFFLQPNEGAYKSSLKTAIDYFNTYAGLDAQGNQVGPMAGGVCFFSAGNDSKQWGSPGCYPGAVSVGAIGPQGTKAYYSNYGDWVDIAAPGGDANYTMILSTGVNNKYLKYQGTSMACPHVSGVAALIVSAVGGKGFTREMLLDRLYNGTNQKINLDGMKIGKLVDAYGAITYGADNRPDPVTDLAATVLSNQITANWTVTGKDRVGAAGYVLFYGKSRSAVQAATPDKPGDGVGVVTVNTREMKIGKQVSVSLSDLDFETTYYIKVKGYDNSLNYGSDSGIVSAKTQKNNPPEITSSVSLDGIKLHSFEELGMVITVSDPDGHTFTVDYVPGNEAGEVWAKTSDNTYAFRIIGSIPDAGSYKATVTATDSYGKKATLSIPYTILPNHQPTNVKTIENILLESGGSHSFALGDYISDPDGETLAFEINNSGQGVVHATVTSGSLYLTALGYGLAEIVVTGLDAKKEKASQTFKVLVRDVGVAYQAYPNPVKDKLFIATGLQTETADVALYSLAGGKVYEDSVQASAFDPAVIDMSQYAPGQYALTLRFGGNDYRQTIIKK